MSAVSTIILSQVPTKFNAKADIPERTKADLHCKEKRDVLNHLKFGKYKMGIAICREVCYDISPKRTLVHVECTYPGNDVAGAGNRRRIWQAWTMINIIL